MNQLRNVFVCIVLVGLTTAYQTGAPDKACETMVPGHGPSPQTGKSPYRIMMQKTETSGEPLEIVLTASTSGPPFKGFFIQVREKGGNAPVGRFDPNSDPLAQPVDCGGQPSVAMTHKDGTPKVQVKLLWTPPEGKQGEYEPMVTFVKQQDTFWVKEKPDKAITVTASGPPREGADGNTSQEVSGRGKDKGTDPATENGSTASSIIPFFSAILLTSATAMIVQARC